MMSTYGLTRYTIHTITTKEALLEELKRVNVCGYVFDNEECEEGMRCVAVPVWDYTRKVIACISISGSAVRPSMEHLQNFLPQLQAAAQSISLKMGCTP